MNQREQAKQEKKDRILAFAESFITEHHRSPSTQETAEALGVNKSTVWRYLVEMDADGILKYDGKTILSVRESKSASALVLVPVSGVIPCGTPEEQEERTDQYVPLPRELLGPGDYFILRASGDSMVDANIDSGDLVIVRRASEAKPGEIVAAIADNASTLKRLQLAPDGRPVLHPENAAKGYPDLRPAAFSIQGVAVKIIKDL